VASSTSTASGSSRWPPAESTIRCLCAPDKFRGTLTASEAAAAFAAGLREAGLTDLEELPLADGGEGTLDVVLAHGGERRESLVTGPGGRPVPAEWGLLPDGTAVLELARASGLALVAGANDPVAATTRGTGELIAIAAEAGASRVLLGVGGSATTDGGRGAIEALGWALPVPVMVACDVTTRFVDAARVFGPQKGATAEQVELLTRRLERLADLYRERTGVDVTSLPGSGAAGGIAGGLAALGAELRPGFGVVADAVGFDAALGRADVVLTGEGKVDRPSLAGKVVGEVLRAAAARDVGAWVVAGEVEEGLADLLPGSPRLVSLAELSGSAEVARREAGPLVREAARQLAVS
jgi:glycerate kinase